MSANSFDDVDGIASDHDASQTWSCACGAVNDAAAEVCECQMPRPGVAIEVEDPNGTRFEGADRESVIEAANASSAYGRRVAFSTKHDDVIKWSCVILPYLLRWNMEDDDVEVRFDGGDWKLCKPTDWRDIRNMHSDHAIGLGREATAHDSLKQFAVRAKSWPERDRLNRLARDHTDKPAFELQHLLDRLFVVGDEIDSRVKHAASELLIGGRVQRTLKPGCKLDNMVVLVGAENIGKSETISDLARKQVYECTDRARDITAKRLLENTQGVHVVELAEFKAHYRDIATIKGVISQQVDTDRVAYARESQHKPRNYIFYATTNDKVIVATNDNHRRFVIVSLESPRVTADERRRIIAENLDAWEAECARKVLAGHSYALTSDLIVRNAETANTHFADSSDWWVQGLQESMTVQAHVVNGDWIRLLDAWDAAINEGHGQEVKDHNFDREKKAVARALEADGWRNEGQSQRSGRRGTWYSPPVMTQ